MKLRFNRQELSDTLVAVCSVAAIRTPKEILRCVRLEAKPDVLLLSATDLEHSLRCAVSQVEVEDAGVVLVVAETLAKIVHECSDEVMSLKTEGNLLHVHGAGSHFQIVTQDQEDYPAIPSMEGDADITIEHAVLRRLIEWTVFAAARESTRYAINGVLWKIADKRLTMAATDGRRLSLAHGDLLTGEGREGRQAIVPSKALTLFSRLSVAEDARVSVKITENQLLLDVSRAMISTSLVEGQFPSYQDVVPSDCDLVVRLNAAEFNSALKRAALLTNEESKGVRFAFSSGNLTLSSRAPEQGEAEVSMPVTYQGEPLEIGFNPVFILELLRVAHAEEITFALKEANRPGVLRLDDDFLYVVMPVNLSSA